MPQIIRIIRISIRIFRIMLMKTLKFEPHLIPLILNGQKTSTWRLFDDKNLAAGDQIDFINAETKEKFATAELTRVIEKQFSELTYDDKQGHE
jgi:hypothetical protein